MALPSLHTLQDCADYSKVVEPFLPQLYELADKLVQATRARQGFLDLYATTNPLVSGFALSVLLGSVFLVVSEYNKNYSQVDRCWSLLPTAYIAHFNVWARMAGIPSPRLDAALFFSILWSVSVCRQPSLCRHVERILLT